MCWKCGVFLGFSPHRRFLFFRRGFINFFLYLTHHLLSIPYSHWGFCLNLIHFSQEKLLHPFHCKASLFIFFQLLPYFMQTSSPHCHKRSTVSHLPPTFKSFYITFKIIWRCYYATCGLLWLWLPLLHLRASLMQLKSTVGISGDLHTGMMK